MKVILLRHGQTAGNQKGKYNGRTDDPLCEEGFRQAERTGILPGVSRVFVSPMLRARQTAEICFPNAQQTVISDLREMDFGDFEGRTADEMADDPDYRAWVDGNCEGPCPNGESISGFCQRVRRAFERAVEEGVRSGEDTLYIVAHGGTIMAVMSEFAAEPNSYYEWYVGNCCGWTAILEKEERLKLTAYVPFERLENEKDV